ncbi:MAG: hypothetical protein AB2766_12725 [Candidatus Thiodiazotropha endolucinida]
MLNRTLWCQTEKEHIDFVQEDLVGRTEPLVILGDAGMGKSTLLEWLAAVTDYASCTARQLINRHDPRSLLQDNRVLIIDALDEVSAKREGEALDLVLRKLGELQYPRFVLACRVADWRSTTGREAIQEQYPETPLELHLNPFGKSDALNYLQEKLGEESAKKVTAHFETRGLDTLLGNPQTLNFITEVAQNGPLPNSLNKLFEQITDILQREHRDSKSYDLPPREAGIDAAGVAFAGMIMTDSDTIILNQAHKEVGELVLADVETLPGGGAIEAMLGSRLFTSKGADRFGYVHRRIGEYLGAKWLLKQADSRRKRTRLLALFHSHGLVPASLRGLHAWLIQDAGLSSEIISADPMGVIEYSDANDLTIGQARYLLNALVHLAAENPKFYNWNRYAVRGIAKLELIPDLRQLILQSETPFYLSNLILESIRGTPVSAELTDELLQIALNTNAVYANRSTAACSFVEISDTQALTSFIDTLKQMDDDDSIRLVIMLVGEYGFNHISDDEIVDFVIKCADHEDVFLGVFLVWECNLPDHRLSDILDYLAVQVGLLGKPHERAGNGFLTDFAFHLIVRAIDVDNVQADRLWSWLEPFQARSGYEHNIYGQFEDRIRLNNPIRRAIQHHVLLERSNDKDIRTRLNSLIERSAVFEPSDTDIIALLETLDPVNQNDARWRDIVLLTSHDQEKGTEVRTAAYPFAAHSPELLAWVDGLSHPKMPEAIKQQNELVRKREEKQKQKANALCDHYMRNIERMRKGEWEYLYEPAKAYLNLIHISGEDLSPHERVGRWLGDNDLGQAAHEGFEVFIKEASDILSAQEFGLKAAENHVYNFGFIMVAALAGRHRNSVGFDDLSDDLLMVTLIHIYQAHIDARADIEDFLKHLEQVVQDRGIWAILLQLFIKPQLEAHCDHISGMELVVGDNDKTSSIGSHLTLEWLNHFDDLAENPETGLIDFLLRLDRHDELRQLSTTKVGITDPNRRRNWDVVGLIVDFEATSQRIDSQQIDPDLIWHIRNRVGDRFRNDKSIYLAPTQIGWIITRFRSLWPKTNRPSNVTSGDSNTWDASEYIEMLIRRLGNNPSQETSILLARLRDDDPDVYSELIKTVLAEQTRIRIENTYSW